MANKINGWVKKFFLGLAVAGIIWNAATSFNDVKHLKREVAEIKNEVKEIRTILLSRDGRNP